MKISADYAFEIEVALSGTFQPGYPDTGPSFSSAGEPGAPDMIEDVAIEDIGIVSQVFVNGQRAVPLRWATKSILDGVDRNSDAYRRICANILDLIGEEAEQALIDGASE